MLNEQKWGHTARAPGVEVLWEQRCAVVRDDMCCLGVLREFVELHRYDGSGAV